MARIGLKQVMYMPTEHIRYILKKDKRYLGFRWPTVGDPHWVFGVNIENATMWESMQLLQENWIRAPMTGATIVRVKIIEGDEGDFS